MSMEIQNKYGSYYENDLRQLESGRPVEEAGEVKEAGRRKPIQDEYTGSEILGSKPSGLYYLGEDEHGNPKVVFDDPKRPGGDGVDAKASGKKVEECTTNTDQVDRDIDKLKREKRALEQQIKAQKGDEEKVKMLKQKLAQIENELSQKDNDTYRRQQATHV